MDVEEVMRRKFLPEKALNGADTHVGGEVTSIGTSALLASGEQPSSKSSLSIAQLHMPGMDGSRVVSIGPTAEHGDNSSPPTVAEAPLQCHCCCDAEPPQIELIADKRSKVSCAFDDTDLDTLEGAPGTPTWYLGKPLPMKRRMKAPLWSNRAPDTRTTTIHTQSADSNEDPSVITETLINRAYPEYLDSVVGSGTKRSHWVHSPLADQFEQSGYRWRMKLPRCQPMSTDDALVLLAQRRATEEELRHSGIDDRISEVRDKLTNAAGRDQEDLADQLDLLEQEKERIIRSVPLRVTPLLGPGYRSCYQETYILWLRRPVSGKRVVLLEFPAVGPEGIKDPYGWSPWHCAEGSVDRSPGGGWAHEADDDPFEIGGQFKINFLIDQRANIAFEAMEAMETALVAKGSPWISSFRPYEYGYPGEAVPYLRNLCRIWVYRVQWDAFYCFRENGYSNSSAPIGFWANWWAEANAWWDDKGKLLDANINGALRTYGADHPPHGFLTSLFKNSWENPWRMEYPPNSAQPRRNR